MKFFAIAALATAVLAADQSSSSKALSAFEQCIHDHCPNDPHNVNCNAACQNIPNPNGSMISETNECYKKCTGLDYQAAIDCHNKCNAIYNPTGVIVTSHIIPAGVTPTSSDKAPTATDTESKPSSSDKSDTATDGGEPESDESGSDESDETTDTGSGAAKNMVAGALAIVAAVAALV